MGRVNRLGAAGRRGLRPLPWGWDNLVRRAAGDCGPYHWGGVGMVTIGVGWAWSGVWVVDRFPRVAPPPLCGRGRSPLRPA